VVTRKTSPMLFPAIETLGWIIQPILPAHAGTALQPNSSDKPSDQRITD
jgi:hypothetical protein